jgi:deoxycytidylate deaminase
MTKKNNTTSSRRRDLWTEHRQWLDLAAAVAALPVSQGGSPHPSVRVGAILVDAKGLELAAASNRFAGSVDRRRPERYKNGSKSLWINCAEQLALMQALIAGKKVKGARLYVTLEPCAVCAGMIAELQLSEVCVPVDSMRRYAKLKAKWKESIEVGRIKLEESHIRLTAVDTQKPKRQKN